MHISKKLSLFYLLFFIFVITPSNAAVKQHVEQIETVEEKVEESINKKEEKKIERRKIKNERKKMRIKLLAVFGGIFGLLSIFTFSVFFISVPLAVLAVALSAIAKNSAEKIEGGKKLRRWALIGIILGGIMLAYWTLIYFASF